MTRLALTAVVAIVGSGCVGFGFNPSGDGSAGDVARSDSPRDGFTGDVARPDGPTVDGCPGDGPTVDGCPGDGPTVDGCPGDGPTPDQTPGDGGVPPGTWVTIAKGTFAMGSPTSEPCRFGNEEQHQVTLTHGFDIQTTEVTQAQFQSLMGYNPASFTSCGTDCPVEMVSWHEAAAYCNALSSNAGKPPCYACSASSTSVTCQEEAAYSGQKVYTCPGYRLPTEAEWEYACRAGTTTAYHSGGNEATTCSICSSTDANADKVGWYCANASGTHTVGLKQPNTWGLFDMAGNVWEWCHDWHQGTLGSSPVTDPWGSPPGTSRAVRGGSWSHFALNTRAAVRDFFILTKRYNYLGFRCARTN